MSRRTFGFLLVIVLSLTILGCQAKDYKERMGQYEVNFTLPDDVASTIEMNKTIKSGIEIDGNSHNDYAIELKMPGTNQSGFGVSHYNRTLKAGFLDKFAEMLKDSGKSMGQTCNSSHQIIDGHEGFTIDCLGSKRYDDHAFGYQLDNKTLVYGLLSLDWNTTVLPFLKSLHVRVVE